MFLNHLNYWIKFRPVHASAYLNIISVENGFLTLSHKLNQGSLHVYGNMYTNCSTHWGRDKMVTILENNILKWIFLYENL